MNVIHAIHQTKNVTFLGPLYFTFYFYGPNASPEDHLITTTSTQGNDTPCNL